jgi:hypothetical protein
VRVYIALKGKFKIILFSPSSSIKDLFFAINGSIVFRGHDIHPVMSNYVLITKIERGL